MSAWRDEKNRIAEARLRRALPPVFPGAVLHHALTRPLVPVTPRRAVEGYFRAHPLRADRLARALASRSTAPEGWAWRLGAVEGVGRTASFRTPPAPFREGAHARGPGQCCICGQPIFRLTWHRDLWGDGRLNRTASWHAACVEAWRLWCDPSGHVKALKRQQRHRCAATGARLFRTAEIDHRVPLFSVWRGRDAHAWPAILAYWGAPNLQVVNRAAHVAKCAREAGQRAAGLPVVDGEDAR
jgi:hypothetical protein